MASLIDLTQARGFAAETCALDKRYDVRPVYERCEDRGCRPIIPLREKAAVKAGQHKPPTYAHGEWGVRRVGREARRDQVALPDRRV